MRALSLSFLGRSCSLRIGPGANDDFVVTSARFGPGDIGRGATSTPNADPFPSTYVPFPSRTTVIRNVNILTAAGPLIRKRCDPAAERQDRGGRCDG